MTPDQANELLKLASVYDGRKPSDLAATVWAADLDDAGIEPVDAAQAIRRHYRDRPDVWIKPGHVVALMNEVRRERREAEQSRLALEAVNTDRPDVVGEDGMPRIRAMLATARARAAARANLAANPTGPEGPRV